MTDLKKPLTYVIIESEKNFGYQILGSLLSIQSINPLSTIVLSVNHKTRKLIDRFPLDMKCTIDYFENTHILNCKYNTVRKFFHNLYETSHYVVNKYGRCIFVNEFLIMINKIEIPDYVEEQGFGFVNKFFNGHDKKTRNREYSFELIFMNSLTFAINLHELIKEKYNIDISDTDEKYREITMDNNLNLPLDLLEKYEITQFLRKQSLITTEDFFSFKDVITLNNVKDEFKFNDILISFVGLRLYQPEPQLKKLNEILLKYLTTQKKFLTPIIMIKFYNDILTFTIPKKTGIGLWSREEHPLGLYQLVDYYVEEYSEYFTKTEGAILYFNIGGNILYDKPDISCLSTSMNSYINTFLFNSNNQVKKELDKHIKGPNYFVFHYADYPIDLHKFRNENEILTNKRIGDKLSVSKVIKNGKTRYPATGRRGMLYKTLLHLLHSHKYAHMKTHDFGLMMTLIGTGTIPVLKEPPTEPFKLLKENVHYLVAKKDAKPLSKKKYEVMRKNLNGFYEEHLHPEKTIRKLMHHLFIRDVE